MSSLTALKACTSLSDLAQLLEGKPKTLSFVLYKQPEVHDTQSKIEEYFDNATKAIVVDGKTFNDGASFDVDKHYGKKVFAHAVVRAKAETIDFTGFIPLLTNLVAASNAHKATSAAPPIA